MDITSALNFYARGFEIVAERVGRPYNLNFFIRMLPVFICT